MNQKLKIIMRLIRNTFVALISVAWALPFFASLNAVLIFLEMQEAELVKADYPTGPPFSYIELSKWFLVIAEVWVIVVIAFWAFVLVNKLWPIKGKPKDQQKQ